MTQNVLYLAEKDVVAALSMPAAIHALESMLKEHAVDHVRNVPKTLGTWGQGSSMHALGSFMTSGGHCGFKTWVHTPQGGGSLFTLFDSSSGRLLAIIEARALGMMRTAAICGVATRLMAPANTQVAALIGTGPQAVTQLAALAASCAPTLVKIFSPTPAKREAFVEQLAPNYPFELRACDSLQEALSDATVVTTVTRASEPFIHRSLLAEKCHINAMGAILPSKAELDQDIVRAADFIAVDSRENALRGSRELREHLGTDPGPWQEIPELGLLAAGQCSPPDGARLTLFKGMGMGLSDLAMARHVHEYAVRHGVGIALPAQTRENLLAQPSPFRRQP